MLASRRIKSLLLAASLFMGHTALGLAVTEDAAPLAFNSHSLALVFGHKLRRKVTLCGRYHLDELAETRVNNFSAHAITVDGHTRVPTAALADGALVYRGVGADPRSEAFDNYLTQGIQAPGYFNRRCGALPALTPAFTSLREHQEGTGPDARHSIFVSTSRRRDVALEFTKHKVNSEKQATVFVIRVPKDKGIDVNVALGSASLYKREEEVAIVGRVDPQDIVGYYAVLCCPAQLGAYVPLRYDPGPSLHDKASALPLRLGARR